MGKVLSVTAILGAVVAAAAIAVLVPGSLAMFLPLLVGLVGSIALLGQRNIAGAVAGIAVLVLTVVAALGLVGTVSTEDGAGVEFGISQATGQVLAIMACLALPIAAVALRWPESQPRWLAVGGCVSAGLAILLAALDPDGLAQQNQADTLIAAVLALLSIAAVVPLLRGPPDEARPGAATPGPSSPPPGRGP